MTIKGFITSIAMIISLVLILSGLSNIAEGNGNETRVRVPDVEQIGGSIRSFAINLDFKQKNFIERAKKFGKGLAAGDVPDFTSIKDRVFRVWRGIDGWFLDITGFHVADILEKSGKIVVWFLEFALRFLKRLLALFGAPQN